MNRRQGGVQVCMSFQKTNKQAKPKQLFAEKKEREFVIFIVHTYIYFFISFLVMTTHDFNIFFHCWPDLSAFVDESLHQTIYAMLNNGFFLL